MNMLLHGVKDSEFEIFHGDSLKNDWEMLRETNPAKKPYFDAVVAMYHDQGLAPLKAVAFDTGVNWTLGLPFIRTSPDHGTAYDIAGKGIANPSSMIAAIRLAKQLAKNKKA